MNKEEIITFMINGFIEDMKYIYSTNGISEEDSAQHIDQGRMSFELICTNTFNRLVDKSVINL